MDLGVNQSNDSEKKWKGYNWCYSYDDEEWLKDSCADCPMCIVDDIFYEAYCKKKDPCENG